MQMTFTQFLSHAGLWLPGETAGDKLRQIKQLDDQDRAWFAERARIECGIEIVKKHLGGT